LAGVCRALIDEFTEDGAQLIRSQNKTNAHTQNASEGQRADKFTSDNAKGLHDTLYEVKRITDHSHNIRAQYSANSSIWQNKARSATYSHTAIIFQNHLDGKQEFNSLKARQ
jgi:hypothetical protein